MSGYLDELRRICDRLNERERAALGERWPSMHFDKEGNPLGLGDWAYLRETAPDDYRRVGLDYVGPYEISTVWVGINLALSYEELPLIFETMVFTDGGEPAYDPDSMSRYSSLEQAEEGHAETVRRWREKLERAVAEEHRE